jgi:glutamate-1-semialdehyde 2,1-aminomutase
MTEALYADTLKRANLVAKGLRAAIARRGFDWQVTQLGLRMEFQFCAEAPRNAQAARAAMHDALEAFIHLYLLNRGVLITPFHNMLLVCPKTSPVDVSRLITAFDTCLEELAA